MHVSMIAAMTPERVIGADGKLPWHLPADLRHFKRITVGRPVIMGRKTFASLGRPLVKRSNIVLSRDPAFRAELCEVARSVPEALSLARDRLGEHEEHRNDDYFGVRPDEIMILGGGEVYRLFLPQADRLYLTFVDAEVPGDTFFPEIQAEDWQTRLHETHEPAEKNACRYAFLRLDRLEPGEPSK